jgi:predicted XRE-type DNA-binding protein
MSTDTSRGTFDQPSVTGANPKRPPDKVMRIAAMTKQLLDEVRAQRLDAPGIQRLRAIDTQTIRELQTDLTPDLRQELQRLALPLTSHTGGSDAELRIAHAQLVGWLEGLLKTMQTTVSSPDIPPATTTPRAVCTSESGDNIPTAPNDREYPAGETHNTEPNLIHESAANKNNAAILAARRTLITAITKRVNQKRLTAAQAASVLHLTGPKVTKLLDANIDEFTLDELVNLLPALELTIQVVPEPQRYVQPSGREDGRMPATPLTR